MKASLLNFAAPLLLGALLSACGQSSNAATGGRPELPTDSEVRHPAAPKGASVFLNLLTDAGESLYQVSVAADATATKVESAGPRRQVPGPHRADQRGACRKARWT